MRLWASAAERLAVDGLRASAVAMHEPDALYETPQEEPPKPVSMETVFADATEILEGLNYV